MKKLLVLAAGILQIPVIEKARAMGYYVIAADGNPLAEGLKYADKAIVSNITSEEEMLKVARAEKIDGVIHPCSEVAMNVMGRINDELNLHGVSQETAIKATNKKLMREAFEIYGAPSPKSFCSSDAKEGYKLFKSLDSVAILKPSRSSGSRGISKLEKDVIYSNFCFLFERAKRESRDATVMIEQFVDGPEFSVEIIVWNGNVNIIQVTDKKTTGAPYFVELGHSQPSCFPSDVINIVKEAAIRGVKSLYLNDCAAHVEIKYEGGKAFLMEVGARLGGDFISTDLTFISTGIDMSAAAINVALGIKPNLLPTAKLHGVAIRYFTPPAGIVRSIDYNDLFECPDLYCADIYIKEGDVINEVKSSLDRSGHIIVMSSNVLEAVQTAERLLKKVIFDVKVS